MPTIPLVKSDDTRFPPVEMALKEPEGLLAAGGDLSVERLLEAYRQGIFPWYEEGQPILWWSPDPRCVVFPSEYKISRSIRKVINKGTFTIRMDTAFREVIEACAAPRSYSDGTWITDDMLTAYCRLHHQGYAHSVECWQDGTLVGGLYGVSLGRVFFGESMFSRVSNASKVAFVNLVNHCQRMDFPLIDCQVTNHHLLSLGAHEIPRERFTRLLQQHIPEEPPYSPFRGNWHTLFAG
ncbi:MAG: leucyl/phenylalanyl-tRNA--protein transferase [Ketobacteraceae bacterium]|nr:leucyl/phenylalanyl-tRNA--protein transferase [Ketobacteraceae bacterium]